MKRQITASISEILTDSDLESTLGKKEFREIMRDLENFDRIAFLIRKETVFSNSESLKT